MRRYLKNGFSLIEIAIAITIIALIVGAVLVGRSLVNQAELRSVISDVQKFASATLSYKEKYLYLPGDTPNATSIWGADSSCPNTAANSIPKAATCDGDGDGIIDFPVWPTAPREPWRYWQQLANAGLVGGSYSGTATSGSNYNVTGGVNAPASRISGATYFTYYQGYHAGDATTFTSNYGTITIFGKSNNGMNINPVITTEQAYNIDVKLDDGLPAFGNVMAWKSSSPYTPGCTSTDVASTAVYAVTTGGVSCALMFKMDF